MKNSFILPKCPIKIAGKDFNNNKEKAEVFVENYAKISYLDQISCNDEPLDSDDSSDQDEPHESMNTNITLNELEDALRCLKNKKSAVGNDGISYTLLANLPKKWQLYVLNFLQKCWSLGKIPQVWKTSIIIPILKQGKTRTDPLSYRPIALTSHFCKLFEKIILGLILSHCNKHNIIPVEQAGFKEGRCTLDHLTKITTAIKHQFSGHKSLLATFFDVKKKHMIM